MKKTNILLILSLLLVISGYRGFREYFLITKGNKLSLSKKYQESHRVYKDAIDRYKSNIAEENSVINLYNGHMYNELLDTTIGPQFLKGNSEVYLGETEQDPNSQIEGYQRALEEYREAMKKLDDINIKKNYEIIALRIEDLEQQQKQQQNNDQDEQKKDQSNSEDKENQENQKKSEKDQKNNQQDQQQSNQEKDKESNQTEQENQDKQDTDKQKNKQENQNNHTEPHKQEPEDSTEIKEALATLERLENSEEQAFKNNERLQYLGGDTDESW